MFEYFAARNSDVDADSKIPAQLDKAIALDPENIHAYRTKGQFLVTSGRPREALRVIDAGLAVDPTFRTVVRHAEHGAHEFA